MGSVLKEVDVSQQKCIQQFGRYNSECCNKFFRLEPFSSSQSPTLKIVKKRVFFSLNVLVFIFF